MSESPDPIRLRYRLGPSDAVRALELHTACPGLIGMLGWAVSAAAIALVASRNEAPAWVVHLLLGLSGVLAAFVVAVPACAAWHWHRARGFFAPQELTADDQGLDVAGGRRRSRLPWAAIRGWLESPQQFLLYESRADFVVVPKHAFASVAELNAFRAALGSHLGPSGRRWHSSEGRGRGRGEGWHSSR